MCAKFSGNFRKCGFTISDSRLIPSYKTIISKLGTKLVNFLEAYRNIGNSKGKNGRM